MRAVSPNLLLLLASCCMWHCSYAVPNIDYNLRIFGGKPVNITEVPYMALYRFKDDLWHCGAVIVHEQFLVSAGHCLLETKDRRVTVGTDNVNSGEDYEIEKVFQHPKFYVNSSGIDYDISVIKLKKKLTFSERVKAIRMADYSLVPKSGDPMEVMGFGTTQNSDLSKQLLEVKVPYVNIKECRKIFTRDAWRVTDRMICAGGERGKDCCGGDSGGPLVYKKHLIGIVSWSYRPCGKKNIPSIYSYVPSMRDFIDGVIKNNS